MFMSFFKQKGFSLLEITVTLGLMGIISIVTMKIVEENIGNQSVVKANAEISQTVSLVKSLLNNPKNCQMVLAGKEISSSQDSGISFSKISLPIGAGEKIYLEENKKYQHFRIASGDIQLAQSTIPSDKVSDLILKFRIKKKKLSLWGDETKDQVVTKRISFLATYDSTNKLSTCGPLLSDSNTPAIEQFCNSLGPAAFWDGTHCRLLDMRCPVGQVPEKLVGLGGVTCVPIENQIDLNQIVDSGACTVSGANNIAVIKDTSSGKLKVLCGTCTVATPCSTIAANVCQGSPAGQDSCENDCGMGTKPATCSDSGNYCSGQSYTSSNGCGNCTGTKGPDCSDSGNYCSGTSYSSSNGCGNCTGTKDCSGGSSGGSGGSTGGEEDEDNFNPPPWPTIYIPCAQPGNSHGFTNFSQCYNNNWMINGNSNDVCKNYPTSQCACSTIDTSTCRYTGYGNVARCGVSIDAECAANAAGWSFMQGTNLKTVCSTSGYQRVSCP